MANANFSVGQVNITDYLMINARKVSNPTVIAASVPPFIPPSTSINISIPGLEATTYYIDFRESPDGIAIGTLLATYVYDVKNDQLLAEMHYYQVDGPKPTDPASNQDTLVDAALDGKNIFMAFKEGFRPLVPPTEIYKEYDLVAGGGIKLLNGILFSPGEVMVVWISYVVQNPGNGLTGSSGFVGRSTITASLTMDGTYFNKTIKCEGVGTRLVVTFPPLASIPDNTQFYFTTNKGTQLQTKFITQGGELFEHAGEDVQELTLGKGEFLHIIKYGTRFEIFQVHANVLRVGQRFSGRWKDHMNTMPEDDRVLDGDDYPRPWYWIKNKLPVTHVIVTTDALIAAFVRPVGKEALFIICSDSKKFRMPNAQGWSEKGLKNFTAYGTDTLRDYDYPSGTMKEMVGPHAHPGDDTDKDPVSGKKFVKRKPGGPGGGLGLNNAGGGFELVAQFTGKNLDAAGNVTTKNIVDNIGIIYLTCM